MPARFIFNIFNALPTQFLSKTIDIPQFLEQIRNLEFVNINIKVWRVLYKDAGLVVASTLKLVVREDINIINPNVKILFNRQKSTAPN